MRAESGTIAIERSSPAATPEFVPVVSVIIPTLRRPDLVQRAIGSVLNQSFPLLEIIVVVDGPDLETERRLAAVADRRLKIIVNPQSLGAGRARNVGVACARGRLVAFLDDDDEWLPEKLARQVELAGHDENVIVCCLSRVVRPQGTEIWPTEIFGNDGSFGEYLFDKSRPFAGAAFIQTSSQLLPRSLYLRSPFPEKSTHDDWEFVIRLLAQPQTRLLTVPDALVVHYVGAQAQSLSSRDAWKASLAWIRNMGSVMSPKAYAGFCLGVIGPRAASERDYAAIPAILWEAFRHGRPQLGAVMFFVAAWLVPMDLRQRVRLALQSWRCKVA